MLGNRLNRIKKYLFLICLLFAITDLYGQSSISISTNVPIQLTVCGAADSFGIAVTNNSSSSLANVDVTVVMPPGTEYQKNSVKGAKQQNISNLTEPVFRITQIPSSSKKYFAFKAGVNCKIISYLNQGNPARNFVKVDYGSGNDSTYTSQYSVKIPSISVTNITNKTYTGIAGDTINRAITITNSGSGELSGFTFAILPGSDMKLDAILGHSTTQSGDTFFVQLSGNDFKKIGDKDKLFENNEQITLNERSIITGCSKTDINYFVLWGCGGSNCEVNTSSSSVIISNKNPSLYFYPTPSYSTCYDSSTAEHQKLMIINRGVGPARDIISDIFLSAYYPNGYYNTTYSHLDTNSFKVRINGGVLQKAHLILKDTTVNYSCFNVSKAYGRVQVLIDLLGPGDTAIIYFDEYNCCVDRGYSHGWGYNVTYENQCKNSTYNTGNLNGLYRFYQGISSQNAGNNTIRIGTKQRVYISHSRIYLNPYTTGAYMKLEFTFPRGMEPDTSVLYFLTSDGLVKWSPDSIKLSGGINIGYYLEAYFGIPVPTGFDLNSPILVIDIGAKASSGSVACGGSNNVHFKTKYVPDPNCKACKAVLYDQSLKFNFDCVNGSQIGIYATYFDISRSSFGKPDNNDDGLPDGSGSLNFSLIKPKRAMYGDTLHALYKSRVITNSNMTSFSYGKGTISFTQNRFTLINAKIRIFDFANNKSYVCSNVSMSRSGGDYTFDLTPGDLISNGCNTIPSSYKYSYGDSITLIADFKVTTNIGGNINFIPVSTDFYLSNRASITHYSQKYSINRKYDQISVIGYYFTNYGYETRTVPGCSDVTFSQYYYLSIGPCCSNYAGGNLFPYEYRNWAGISEIQVELPYDYQYKESYFGFARTAGTGKVKYYYYNPITPSNPNARRLTFKVDTFFQDQGGSIPLGDDGYYGYLSVTFRPTCDKESGVQEPLIWIQTHHQTGYLGGGTYTFTNNYADFVTYQAPNLTFKPIYATVTGYNDDVNWTFDLSNTTSNNDADNVWVHLKPFSNGLVNNELSYFSSGSKINPSSGLYKLGTVKGGDQFQLRLDADFVSCSYDSMRVYIGWDCNSYPDSFEAVTCPKNVDSFTIYVEPKQPGIDFIVSSPVSDVLLCDTSTFSTKITNTKEGYGYNQELRVQLPPGVEIIPGTTKMQYPVPGSFKNIPLPDTLGKDWYGWEMNDLNSTLKNNGLPGVLNTLKNKIKVKFQTRTNCDFISGSRVLFYAKTDNKCDTLVNARLIPSNPLNIKGAKAGYSTSLDLYGSSKITTCGNINEFRLSVKNNGNDSIKADDRIYLTLPAGLKIVNGSITGINNPPTDLNPDLYYFGNDLVYSWKSIGVEAGDSVVMKFKVVTDSNLSCQQSYILVRTTSFTNVKCVSTNQNCDIQVETGLDSFEIEITKPSFQIADAGTFAKPDSAGEKIHLNLTVTNNGDTLRTGSGAILKYYFDADFDGKVSSTDYLISQDSLTNIVYPDSTFQINRVLDVPPGKGCNLLAIIDTSGGICLCKTSILKLKDVPLKNAGPDISLCSGDTVAIGMDSTLSYSYDWSPGNNILDSTASQTAFTIINNTSSNLNKTIYLKTNRLNCVTADTLKAVISPPPYVNAGGNKVVCKYDSVRIGGSPLVQGPASSYTHTWYPTTGLYNPNWLRPWAKPLQTTTYYVRVEGTDGCWNIDSVQVIVNELPVVDAGLSDSICKGDTVTLGGNPTAPGDTSGFYFYDWTPSSSVSNNKVTNPTAHPSSTTNFIVEVTDINYCKNKDTATIFVNPLPVVDAGTDTAICKNDSLTLGGHPTASVGRKPFGFYWTDDNNSAFSAQANPKVLPLQDGTYYVEVVDSYQCKSSDSIKVSINDLPTADAGNDDSVCYGVSLTIGGSPSASGGTSPYTYNWSPAQSLSNARKANPLAQPSADQLYILKVIDDNKCFDYDSAWLFVNPLPVADAGTNDTMCPGDTVVSMASVTGANIYNWTPGIYTTDSLNLNTKFIPVSTTTYELKVTSQSGCVDYDSVEIYVRSDALLAAPDLRCVSVASDTKINLTWKSIAGNSEFLAYNIYRKGPGDNTFNLFESISDRSQKTWGDSSVNTATGSYSYFITTENKCGFEGAFSDTISSLFLRYSRIDDKTIKLFWNEKHKGKNTTYKLQKNKGSGFQNWQSLKDTSFEFSSCYDLSSYRIEVTNNCSAFSNVTDTLLINDTIAPAQTSFTVATVDNWSEINLKFKGGTEQDIGKYLIERKKDGGPWNFYDSISENGSPVYQYFDQSVNASSTRYCYRLRTKDTCGNAGIYSRVHCPVNLDGQNKNLAAKLTWPVYDGFALDSQNVQRFENGQWKYLKFLSASDSSFIDTPLPCNQTQFYRLASYGNGEVSFSDSVLVTPFDTIAPQKVDLLSTTVVSYNQIDIKFKRSPEADVNAYVIFVAKNGSNFTAIDTIPNNGTGNLRYEHTGIDASQNTYCYKVIALDSCSGRTSDFSEIHCPIQLEGNGGNYASNLFWSKYKGFDSIAYTVEKWINNSWTALALAGSDTSFIDSPIACNQTFYYRIKGSEINGNNEITFSDSIAIIPFDTAKPKMPDLKVITVLPNGDVKLNWKNSISRDVNDHIILRKSGNTFLPIDTVHLANTYIDTLASPENGPECYRIQALDSCAGNLSVQTETHCTIHLEADTTGCQQQIFLGWTQYQGWDSGQIDKYYIYRTVAGVATLLDSTAAFVTSYIDSLVDYHNTYCYFIEAVNKTNASQRSASNIDCVKTYEPPVPNLEVASVLSTSPANGDVIVKWENQQNVPFIKYQNLYYASGGSFTSLKDSIPLATDSFFHSNLNTKTAVHSYALELVDQCGTSFDWSVAHATMDLNVKVGQLRHLLSWTPYKGETVSAYVVQRFENQKFNDIDTLNGTDTFNNRYPAPCNFDVFYRIKAVLANGFESYSDTVGRTAIDTIPPDAPELYNASVFHEDSVFVKFIGGDSLDIYGYSIERSKNGKFATAGFIPFSKPSDTDLFYEPLLGSDHYCYTIVTLDSCLNANASDTFCLIDLDGEAFNLANQTWWTKFEGYNSKSYTILQRKNKGWDTLVTLPSTDTGYWDAPLRCNQPVDYQIVGTESGGSRVTKSNVITLTPFDTIPPAAPKVEYATVINNKRIGLYFDTVPDTDVMQYEVFYSVNGGKFKSAGVIAQQDQDINEFIHKSLNTRLRNYCYYIKAIDSCAGNISLPSDTHCVSNISSSAGNKASYLSWTGYVGSAIQKYYIQRWINGQWQDIDSVPGNKLTYYDSMGLACNVPYFYRLRGLLANGNITFSDTTAVTPFDTIRPQMPDINFVSVVDGSHISLDWNLSDPDVDRYNLFVKIKKGSWVNVDTIPTGQQYVYSGLLTMDSTYCLSLTAIDSCASNTSSLASQHCVMQLDGYPGHLENHLSWSAYKGFDSLEKYVVHVYSDGSWKAIDTIPGNVLSYTQSNLLCNTDYGYKIEAISSDPFSSFSDSIVLAPYDSVKPQKPDINFASVVDGSHISLDWNLSDPDVDRYNLFIKTKKGSWINVDTIPTGQQYVYSGLLTMDSSYCLSLTAIDSCASNTSPLASQHCLMQLDGYPGHLENHLSWSAYEGFDSLEKYVVHLYSEGSWKAIDTIPGNVLSYTQSNLLCNTDYGYKIEAISSDPFSSFSDSIVLTPYDSVKPQKPDINFSSVVDGSHISLDWNLSDPDVDRYNLFIKTKKGSWVNVDTIPTGQQYVYSGLLTMDSSYCLSLTAIDSCASNTSQMATQHCVIQLVGTPGNLENHLSWSAYEGFDTLEKYVVHVYRNGNWKAIDTLSKDSLNFTHKDLLCKNDYGYKIEAISSDPFSSFSDSIVLAPFDTIKPDAPKVMQASVISNSSIAVKFKASPSTDVAYYNWYYKPQGGTFQLGGQVPDADTGFYDFTQSSIFPLNSSYCYYLEAVDSCYGNVSLPSDTQCTIFLTGKPGNLRSYLNWDDYYGFDQWKYEVQEMNGSVWDSLATLTDTSFTDSLGISCNLNYQYRVIVRDNSGDTSASAVITIQPFDTIKPPASDLLVASVLPNHTIRLKWDYDTTSDVKYHEIWRDEDDGSFAKVGTVIYDSIFIDQTADPQHIRHHYYLRAIDSCSATNISLPSDTHRIVLPELATGACVPLIRLKWNGYKGWINGVDQYVLHRTDYQGSQTIVDTLGGLQLSFVDSAVLQDSLYCYRVEALNNSENLSSFSDTLCMRPWVFPVPDTSILDIASVVKTGTNDGAIELKWQRTPKSDTFARGYKIYHSLTGIAGSFSVVHDESDLSVTSFIHQNINTVADSHYYYLAAYNLCSKREAPASIVHRPVNLEAVNKNLAVDLSWSKYLGFDVNHYELIRSLDGKTYRSLGLFQPGSTSFIDSNIRCDHQYSYKVMAYDSNNNISFSDSITLIGFDTIPPDVAGFHFATVNQTDSMQGVISIEFEQATQANRKGYIIYTSTDGQQFAPTDTFYNDKLGTVTFVDSFLNTRQNTYSYYIRSLDSCGNAALPSDTHRVIHLDATPYSLANQIAWTKYVGWPNIEYRIERKTAHTAWTALTGWMPGNVNIYQDSATKCDTLYFYRIMGRTAQQAWITYSNIDEAVAFETDSPLAPVMHNVTVTQTGETNGAVEVNWNPSESPDVAYYNVYRFDQRYSTWDEVDSFNTGLSFTETNLNTSDKPYRYRIESVDSCDNPSKGYSDPHQTVQLDAIPGNQQATVSWTNYFGWKVREYQLYRDGQLYETLPGGITSYIDTFVTCTAYYKYFVIAVADSSLNIISNSNADSAKPWDTKAPRKTYLITATVESPNHTVRLEWLPSKSWDTKGYTVYRSRLGEPGVEFLDTIVGHQSLSYLDSLEIAGTQTCYYIKTIDYCGNESGFMNKGCIMILNGEAESFKHTLHWNPYREWNGGIESYNIYRQKDSGSYEFIGTVDADQNKFIDEDLDYFTADFCYRVEAEEGPGSEGATSFSTEICLQQPAVVYIPNAFSPSVSYQTNDYFAPQGSHIAKYTMKIYNRWGEIVYSTDDSEPWDGTQNGEFVQMGLYLYEITVTGHDGVQEFFRGNLMVLR